MKSLIVKRDKMGAYTVSTIVIYKQKAEVLYYETIVFKKLIRANQGLGNEVWSDNYKTEQEALDGHNAAVKRLDEGWTP